MHCLTHLTTTIPLSLSLPTQSSISPRPRSYTHSLTPNVRIPNPPKMTQNMRNNVEMKCVRAHGYHLNEQRAEDASTHQPNLRVSCSNPIKWLEIFIACSSCISLLVNFEEFVMRNKKNFEFSKKSLFAYLNSSGRMNALGWMCLEYSLFLQITDDRETFLISANCSELTNQLIFVEFCYSDLE